MPLSSVIVMMDVIMIIASVFLVTLQSSSQQTMELCRISMAQEPDLPLVDVHQSTLAPSRTRAEITKIVHGTDIPEMEVPRALVNLDSPLCALAEETRSVSMSTNALSLPILVSQQIVGIFLVHTIVIDL